MTDGNSVSSVRQHCPYCGDNNRTTEHIITCSKQFWDQ